MDVLCLGFAGTTFATMFGVLIALGVVGVATAVAVRPDA